MGHAVLERDHAGARKSNVEGVERLSSRSPVRDALPSRTRATGQRLTPTQDRHVDGGDGCDRRWGGAGVHTGASRRFFCDRRCPSGNAVTVGGQGARLDRGRVSLHPAGSAPLVWPPVGRRTGIAVDSGRMLDCSGRCRRLRAIRGDSLARPHQFSAVAYPNTPSSGPLSAPGSPNC
jgi:hypothetical protein